MALTVVAAMVVLCAVVGWRYVAALESGMDHTAVVMNFSFWALVCIPVALLADQLLRTIADYRLVRMARAKVRRR